MDDQADSSPIEVVRLHYPEHLLDWEETDAHHYVAGEYEITLIEPYNWEVRHRGEHIEFDDSLRYAFQIAENHHREILRIGDLKRFAGIAAASALGLIVTVILVQGNAVWAVALGALWVAHVYALLEFLYTLARIGRLRGGAGYAMPFGKATYRALTVPEPKSGDL